MKHVKPLTRHAPKRAQFESVLQFVGLLTSVLALYEYVARLFGIPIPQKESQDEE